MFDFFSLHENYNLFNIIITKNNFQYLGKYKRKSLWKVWAYFSKIFTSSVSVFLFV